MDKRTVINVLFVLSFPVYGVGSYVSAAQSPSTGFLISTSIHALIVLFYSIDLIYKREFRIRVNMTYALMMLFLMSTSASLFVALWKGLPETTLGIVITRSLLVIVPFLSFIVVWLYNANDEGMVVKLTLGALSALLVLNLAGFFGLGLVNVTHTIEGRLSFPFLDGFYSGAGLVVIIDLLLIHFMYKEWNKPVLLSAMCVYFMINLVMLHMINSRLATLIFLVILVLMLLKSIRIKGVFFVSLFTIPILLSSGLILYEILKSPALATMMQRVDVEDVTTFHGRSYIWNDAIDWLLLDQRGLLFGNGLKGHYFLDLLPDVVKRWNVPDALYLHLHSTSLEILVNQGLLIYAMYCFIFYRVYLFYKDRHKMGSDEGSFLPVVIFLLFIMQVDTFVYLDCLGSLILALTVSRAAITDEVKATEGTIVSRSIRLKNSRLVEKAAVYDWSSNTSS